MIFYTKQAFLNEGFIFEKDSDDDPNESYYGWMIRGKIKFKWYAKAMQEICEWDNSQKIGSILLNNKNITQEYYEEIYNSSLSDIKFWCDLISETNENIKT